MPTLSDSRFEYLRSQAYTGSASDMLLAWLRFGSTVQVNTISDQWREFFITRGFTPPFSISDTWFTYLGLLGYRGNMNDRELLFWSNGAPIIDLGESAFSNGFDAGYA